MLRLLEAYFMPTFRRCRLSLARCTAKALSHRHYARAIREPRASSSSTSPYIARLTRFRFVVHALLVATPGPGRAGSATNFSYRAEFYLRAPLLLTIWRIATSYRPALRFEILERFRRWLDFAATHDVA